MSACVIISGVVSIKGNTGVVYDAVLFLVLVIIIIIIVVDVHDATIAGIIIIVIISIGVHDAISIVADVHNSIISITSLSLSAASLVCPKPPPFGYSLQETPEDPPGAPGVEAAAGQLGALGLTPDNAMEDEDEEEDADEDEAVNGCNSTTGPAAVAAAAAGGSQDEVIEACLLAGLHAVPDSALPMLSSDFYSKYMLPNRPPGVSQQPRDHPWGHIVGQCSIVSYECSSLGAKKEVSTV